MFAQASPQQLNKTQRDTSVASRAESRPTTDLSARAVSNREMLRRPSQTPLRRKSNENAASEAAPPLVHDVIRSAGRPLEPQTRAFMEPRFGKDLSQIRVHTDGKAAESAQAVGAEAYTVGQHIAFGSNSYSPSTAQGKHLLAHELAHTIQPNGIQTVRRRRVPDQANLDAIMPKDGADQAVHKAGLVRLLRSAWDELSPDKQHTKQDKQEQIRKAAVVFGISVTPADRELANILHPPDNKLHKTNTEDDLLFFQLSSATRDQLLQFAAEVRKADPTAELGDPRLIGSDTGPLPGTPDAEHIAILVAGADKFFDAVATGSRESDIKSVFGAEKKYLDMAKVNFGKAKSAMDALHEKNKIIIDQSGYSTEAEVPGETNTSHISLAARVINAPTNSENIVILIHESMHAVETPHIGDPVYVGEPFFTEMQPSEKLKNAADYEVVAHRMLTPDDKSAFKDIAFIPAGKKQDGVKKPKLTKKQEAIKQASATYHSAWSAARDIHALFVEVFKQPNEWHTKDLTDKFGVSTTFSASLPYWSKVENMTVHNRVHMDPRGTDQSTAPVTEIDIAQSESVIHKLALAMDIIGANNLPEAAVVDLEAKETPAQTTKRAKSASDEAEVIVSLIRSEKLGEITGSVERDERAIARLARADKSLNFYRDVLWPKGPSSFAD